MEKLLYTVKEVSELIHTNQTHVYSLIKAGLLPALKLGAYKIRKEALLDFLETYEGQNLTDPEKIIKIDIDKGADSKVTPIGLSPICRPQQKQT